MILKELELQNYKRFGGKHEIEFSDDSLTVIIGVNGAGKTSILDAIAIILEVLTAKMKGGDKVIKFEMLDVTKNQAEAEIIGDIEDKSRMRDNALASIFVNTSPSGPITSYSSEEQGFLDQLKEDFWDREKGEIPIFIYYRTSRNFSVQGIPEYQLINKGIDRQETYEGAFSPVINYSQILFWYLQQINIQNNEIVKRKDLDYQIPTLKAVTSALNAFIKKIDGTSLSDAVMELSPFSNKLELFITKGEYKLEFNQLSAGEKMVIGMVLDIAYRMSIANPQLENPLHSKGIILIDEIELHLHPRWQSSILKALSEIFPNIQFIATTHSPLVINQLKNTQLILLDEAQITHGKNIHNTYGRDINSILEDFMGAKERPVEIKALIEEIEELLDEDQPDIKLANKKLNNLKSLIDPNDYEIIKLETLIALEEDEADYKEQ